MGRDVIKIDGKSGYLDGKGYWTPESKLNKSIKEIEISSKLAKKLNLKVAAGHGLNYQNVTLISKIPEIEELNIGQSIIARSVFTGLSKAIVDMKELIKND